MTDLSKLPYFQLFSWMEREAAKAAAPYACCICNQPAFYSDVLNLKDHMPTVSIVCPTCRVKYNKSFQLKLSKIRDKK